jgi:hypothetical protein
MTAFTRTAQRLLQVGRIYAEPEARGSGRGQEILARFPDAEIVEVDSHWKIPELHGNAGNVERWVRVKTEMLVLGVKKSLSARPNGRSADFIAPSTSNGCAMACAYCYVPRRKGYANPITVFTNIDKITRYLRGHVRRQGAKPTPDQIDPTAWVYDIGEKLRLLGGRAGQRQRRRPRRHVPRPADGEGELRDEVRQPRAARPRPAGPHPDPVLADARARRQAA